MFRTFFSFAIILATSSFAQAQDAWWSELDSTLSRAGDNRTELEHALEKVPAEQRDGMAFLIGHMPQRDLKTLKSAFLLENVAYAYRARNETSWGKQVPESIFLNDVLPYVNVNETRDAWRKDFYEKFMPLVKDCQTPAEAAQRLNKQMFKMINVKYSTKRNRADQGPKESMKSGLASCTGLSILLSDACRSVGVPARLAGIPNWVNKRGNHTWIEVWDKEWHFTGAAEPSSKGLNHVWFRKDASLAKIDVPKHSIYAASYKPTGLSFPMVWAWKDKSIAAVNVTSRYQISEGSRVPTTRLLVRVYDADGERTTAPVKVTGTKIDAALAGESRNQDFDTNDILAFELARKGIFEVTVADGENEQTQKVESEDQEQLLIDFNLKN